MRAFCRSVLILSLYGTLIGFAGAPSLPAQGMATALPSAPPYRLYPAIRSGDQASFTQMFKEGYALNVRQMAYDAEGRSFTSLWEHKFGLGFSAYSESSVEKFEERRKREELERGLTLVSLDGAERSDGLRSLGGIWLKWQQPRSKIDTFIIPSEWDELVAARVEEGLRLADFDVSGMGDWSRFHGLWMENEGPEWELRELAADEVTETVAERWAEGWRDKEVVGWENGEANRFFVHFLREGSRAQRVLYGLNDRDLIAGIASAEAEGFRPIACSPYASRPRVKHTAVLVQEDAALLPQEIPSTGSSAFNSEEIDSAMTSFMGTWDISAATLCVLSRGEVLVERGYGWADHELSRKIEPHAPFRLAQLTETVTAAATRKLATEGLLDLDGQAFNSGQTGEDSPGVLKIIDAGDLPSDPRVIFMTVDHLLSRRSGMVVFEPWDDMISNSRQIHYELGKAPVSAREVLYDVVKAQYLQHEPGKHLQASWLESFALGLIVEQTTGKSLGTYASEALFKPLGGEIVDGASAAYKVDPQEPVYLESSPRTYSKIHVGERVEVPYGGFILEDLVGSANLVSSAADYAKFFERYHADGRLCPAGVKTFEEQVIGALPGSSALARRQANGSIYVVLMNRSEYPNRLLGTELADLLDTPIAKGIESLTAHPTTTD